MSFSSNVYRILKEKNKSQAAVARAAGLNPHQFNDLLKGRKLLRAELVIPICKALDAEPNDLFLERGDGG